MKQVNPEYLKYKYDVLFITVVKMNLKDILKLYPEYDKVYGPYKRKDGRMHIVLNNTQNATKKTISYPKALVEIREGRILENDETVDHDDRDVNNNSLNNLVILVRKHHCELDAKRAEYGTAKCIYCNIEFELTRHQYSNKKRKNRDVSGPFCSKSCIGKYTRDLQLNKTEKLSNITPDAPTYYKLNK